MGSGLTFYFKIAPHICRHFSYVWGEPTHFVHDADSDGDGIPLNKEWSVCLMFLWFYVSVSYDTGWRELEDKT